MAIILNDNIDTRAPKPTDDRFGPYTTTAAALASIPEYQRYVGLTVGVGTPIVEWWFDSTLTLVLKTTSGTVKEITAGLGIDITGTSSSPIISITTPTQLTTNISTDVITDQSSDTKYPSVKATKTYVDANIVGLLDDRGNFAASPTSPGDYPITGGSGPAGAIVKGDIWFISVPGFLNTTEVGIGASVRALVDNPGVLTDADWDILDTGLGFVPENVDNKVTDGSSITAAPNNATLYPSLKALTEYLSTVIPTTPTLQQVTDQGATTTNPIIVGNLSTDYVGIVNTQIQIANQTQSASLNVDNITAYKNTTIDILRFPTGIPSNLATIPVSVNNQTADAAGNITIPVVTGTGTPDYVSKWSTSTNLTDSQIFDNGTNVGVGTAIPNSGTKLDVNGFCHIGTGTPSPYIGSLHTMEITASGTAAPLTTIGGTSIIEVWSDLTKSNGAVSYGAAFPGAIPDGNIHFATFQTGDQSWRDRIIVEKNEGRVRIGAGNVTAVSSALLEVNSTTKGFLPPKMTQTERLAIVSPAEGLIVYDTTNSALGVYSGGGWRKLSMESF